MYQIVRNSFNDSPDGTALVFFFNKCNMRCKYCYNHELFLPNKNTTNILSTFNDCQNELSHQLLENNDGKTFLRNDWLILSGGEPLMMDYDEFVYFATYAHSIGMKVGMWTNLTYDEEQVYKEGELINVLFNHHTILNYLDWINIDFKGFEKTYQQYGINNKQFCLLLSRLKYLFDKNIDIQLSTVLTNSLMTEEEFVQMTSFIDKALFVCSRTKPITWRFVKLLFPSGHEQLLDASMTINEIFPEPRLRDWIKKYNVDKINNINVKIIYDV